VVFVFVVLNPLIWIHFDSLIAFTDRKLSKMSQFKSAIIQTALDHQTLDGPTELGQAIAKTAKRDQDAWPQDQKTDRSNASFLKQKAKKGSGTTAIQSTTWSKETPLSKQ